MDFINDIYAISFEGIIDGVYQYRFISSVNGNDITKIVSLSPQSPLWYNLSFGNLEMDAHGEPVVSDTSLNNNNDFDKVLATVFACLMQFLNSNPDAQIVFFGNTEHKHTLYKRKIAANLTELQEYFLVKGGFADFKVATIETLYTVQKNGKTITRKIHIKDHTSLKINSLKGMEIFNRQRTKEYHFVLIGLTDVL